MAIDESLLLKDLQILGLTPYESRVYIALTKLGSAEASKIINTSQVPQKRVYQILQGLKEKGLIDIEQIRGGANLYRTSLSPSQGIDHLQQIVFNPLKQAAKRAEQNLTKINRTLMHEAVPDQEIVTIRGKRQVLNSAEVLINSASKLIICNFLSDLLIPLSPHLEAAKNHGVEIRLIIPGEEKQQVADFYPLETIASNVLGLNFEGLKHKSEQLSNIQAPFNLPRLLDLFSVLMKDRPNLLLIDPTSDKSVSLLVMRTANSSVEVAAVEVRNKEFIEFQHRLLILVWDIIATIEGKK
ncbi:MAG: TrmB family transcriptional regulator [Promethearchaeota archaeon]